MSVCFVNHSLILSKLFQILPLSSVSSCLFCACKYFPFRCWGIISASSRGIPLVLGIISGSILGTLSDCRSFLGQFGDHFEGEDHFGVRDHFVPVYSVPLNLHT